MNNNCHTGMRSVRQSWYLRTELFVFAAMLLTACGPTLQEVRTRFEDSALCCSGFDQLRYLPLDTDSSRTFSIGLNDEVFPFASGKSPVAAFKFPPVSEPLRLTVESYMQSSPKSLTTEDRYFFLPTITLLDSGHALLRANESQSRRVLYVPLNEFVATGGLGWKIVLGTDIDPGDRARYALIHTTDRLLARTVTVPALRAAGGEARIASAPIGRLRVRLRPVSELLDSVMIIEHKPAYTIFVGIPAGKKGEVLDALPAKERSTSRVVSWPAFRVEASALLNSMVLHNDYPQVDLRKGVVEFLMAHPGVPFAVTWNGGMAITAGDYAYSERELEVFRSDSVTSQRMLPKDRHADRLNPLNHLNLMLGWD
jgi:hypothetical protein